MTAPQPSNLKAAFWMAGWLAAMLVMAIAGRETTRELDVFQIMEMRSVIGIAMLYPLIHHAGGFRQSQDQRVPGSRSAATSLTTARSSPGSRR